MIFVREKPLTVKEVYSILYSSDVRVFAAMGSSSCNPHSQFLVHSAKWTVGMHRLSPLAERQRHSPQWIGSSVLTVRLEPPTTRLAELVRGANHCATSPHIKWTNETSQSPGRRTCHPPVTLIISGSVTWPLSLIN